MDDRCFSADALELPIDPLIEPAFGSTLETEKDTKDTGNSNTHRRAEVGVKPSCKNDQNELNSENRQV